MKIKQIDFGDIRILLVGLILLIIPVVFLAFVATHDTPGGFSRSSAQERLMIRKSVFNFAPPPSSSSSGGGGSSGNTPAGGVSGNSGGGIYGRSLSEAISRELETAMKVLERSPEPEIDIPGMLPEQKMAMKADMNRDYRMGCAMIEKGDYGEAEKSFLAAIETAGDNQFLQTYALGGLVEIYSRMGRKKELDGAMSKFAEAVSKLPGGLGGDLPLIMRQTAKLFALMKDQVDSSKLAEQASKIPPLPAGLISDPAQIKAAMAATLANFPVKTGVTPGGGDQ
ncbi:MAG: hypothetical protein WA705_24330 [Candidatus Ozemobacteraceae bacterium]